jgi:hypothetical protein
VRGVDVAHVGRDGLFQECDVFARVRESIRAEPDLGHLGFAELQLRSVSPSFSFAIALACVMFERRLSSVA